jgi:Ca2+-binding RTX toxin-like protein
MPTTVTAPGGSTVVVGNQSDYITVFGRGTVKAGNGNDTVTVQQQGHVTVGKGNDSIQIWSSGTVSAGNGNDTITVYGDGSVNAGSGNDRITLFGNAGITLGGGNDTVSTSWLTNITETKSSGHDTITLGFGNDTIKEAGSATVHSSFVNATIKGGELDFSSFGHVIDDVSGQATLVGSSAPTEFLAGTGSTVIKGGSGHDTFVGGSGHDTMGGTGTGNVFEFLASEQGGKHVITNFVSGDQLYIEGHSLSYLQSHHDITTQTHGGVTSTYISIDGGKTTIELQGVKSLSSYDITTHKP